MDAALERVPDLVHRDSLHPVGKTVQVVERQPVETDDAEVVENLAVAVDTQRETADQRLFRVFDFLGCGTLRRELRQRVTREFERLVGLGRTRLQADLKGAGLLVGGKNAVDTVA